MSEAFDSPPHTATTSPQLPATATLAHALAYWNEYGGAARLSQNGISVHGEDGQVISDVFFAPPHFAHELSGAKEVQQRLLPRAVPLVPNFSFAGRYAPAGEVGGDYWSVKFYREENIVTCKLADVSGHGIGSAILMAAIKFVSGVLFRYSPTPAVVMERTNHSLLRETTPDRMATMVYAWLYPDTRRVRLVNAGHAPAFFCRANGELHDVPTTGPLLGLMETRYDEHETTMTPGDVLVFCSDGVAEMGNPTRFGDAGVKEIVRANRHNSAEAIADALFDTAALLGPPPIDDRSLLVIKAIAGPHTNDDDQ